MTPCPAVVGIQDGGIKTSLGLLLCLFLDSLLPGSRVPRCLVSPGTSLARCCAGSGTVPGSEAVAVTRIANEGTLNQVICRLGRMSKISPQCGGL